MDIIITPAAIDQASNRVLFIWQSKRKSGSMLYKTEAEGFYSWLLRVVAEALEKGDSVAHNDICYLGIKFSFINIDDCGMFCKQLIGVEPIS